MNIDVLIKYVNSEIDWLRYYATTESRKRLSQKSEIYDELQPIGYTKRVISLDKRCAAVILCSYTEITILSDLDEIFEVQHMRNCDKNRFTPLEVFWKMFPQTHEKILFNLQCDQTMLIPLRK